MENINAIGLNVRITGVSNAIASLTRIQNQTQQTSNRINALTRAATGFAVAAGSLSYASLKAYDSFARFEQGAKSLLGTLEGGRFAKALQQFAVPSAFSADILRKGAQGLASTGLSGSRSMGILGATTNLAAAGGSTNEELSRTLMALRQIQSKGVVRAEELNQQLAESLPLMIKAVKDQTGKSDLAGMSSKEFFDALIAAGNGAKYGNAQKDLAAASPMIAIQNVVEALGNTLIPTGRLLAKVLSVVVAVVMPVIEKFGKLNEATGGLLGFGIILGLLTSSMTALFGALKTTVIAALGLTEAEAKQLTAIEAVNVALGMFSRKLTNAALFNNGGGIPGIKPRKDWDFMTGGESAASLIKKNGLFQSNKYLRYLRLQNSIGGSQQVVSSLPKLGARMIGDSLGPLLNGGGSMISGIFKFIKPLMTLANVAKATGWGLVITLAIQVIPRLFGNLAKIFGAISKWFGKLWDSVKASPLGQVIEGIINFFTMLWDGLVSILSLDWLVDALGIDNVDEQNADAISNAIGTTVSSSERPLRRGDAENWWYARMSEMG